MFDNIPKKKGGKGLPADDTDFILFQCVTILKNRKLKPRKKKNAHVRINAFI